MSRSRIHGLHYPPHRGFPMGDGLDLSQLSSTLTNALPGALTAAENAATSYVTGAAVTAPTVQAAAKSAGVQASVSALSTWIVANKTYVMIGGAIIAYLAFFRRR